MKEESCCGFVLFTLVKGQVKYLLVESLYGSIGFAKGHVEGDETPLETAVRESQEEVNITPKIVKGFTEATQYYIQDSDVNKSVIYFLGYFDKDAKIICQNDEVRDTILCSYEEALNLIQRDNLKEILMKADKFIHKSKLRRLLEKIIVTTIAIICLIVVIIFIFI